MIDEVRIALGGVAHKPWRDASAEAMLKGRKPETALFEKFADKLLAQAKGQGKNDFKIELAKRAIVRAMQQAAAGTPQDQSNKAIR